MDMNITPDRTEVFLTAIRAAVYDTGGSIKDLLQNLAKHLSENENDESGNKLLEMLEKMEKDSDVIRAFSRFKLDAVADFSPDLDSFENVIQGIANRILSEMTQIVTGADKPDPFTPEDMEEIARLYCEAEHPRINPKGRVFADLLRAARKIVSDDSRVVRFNAEGERTKGTRGRASAYGMMPIPAKEDKPAVTFTGD